MRGGRQHLAELLLIGVTAVWGATFVLVKEAVALYPTLPFLSLRFATATLVIAPIALVRLRRTAPGGTRPRLPLGPGLLMGLLLTAGYVFQTFGLEHTSASNAGFITGLFVVLVPLLELLVFRRWVGRWSAGAAGLAFFGLFLLSGTGPELNLLGDGLVFLCAVGFAGHILATSRFAGSHDPVVLTAVQLGTVAAASVALTFGARVTGLMDVGLTLPSDAAVWQALAITAIFASVIGYLVQTYAQRYAPPTRTALILTMEPVFAGIFGYLLADEVLTGLGWVGAGLILTGMLLAELRPGRRRTWIAAEEGVARVGSTNAHSSAVLEEPAPVPGEQAAGSGEPGLLGNRTV